MSSRSRRRVVYTLSVVCPILFLISPFIQYRLFFIYHKYGHPWSVIFNGQFEDQEEKCEEHEEDIEETNIDADIMKDKTRGNLQAGKNETNINIELKKVKKTERDQYTDKETEDREETKNLIETVQAEVINENQSDSADNNPKLQHSKCD